MIRLTPEFQNCRSGAVLDIRAEHRQGLLRRSTQDSSVPLSSRRCPPFKSKAPGHSRLERLQGTSVPGARGRLNTIRGAARSPFEKKLNAWITGTRCRWPIYQPDGEHHSRAFSRISGHNSQPDLPLLPRKIPDRRPSEPSRYFHT